VVRAQVIDDIGPPVDGTFVFDIGSGAALILDTPFVDKERFLQSGRPLYIGWRGSLSAAESKVQLAG
jgi:hypothetical protein